MATAMLTKPVVREMETDETEPIHPALAEFARLMAWRLEEMVQQKAAHLEKLSQQKARA